MNWFQVLKGKTKRSDSRTNARLVRTVVRPIVNEFVEKEIMPRTNKIYYKEILQIVKKEFIPNPEIRKKIKADPRLKNLTSQQIGSLLRDLLLKGGMTMFRKIIEKLSKTQEEMNDILQRVISQNEDMEDLSEELLGERLSDEIMSQVIEQEFAKAIEERIKEAFE